MNYSRVLHKTDPLMAKAIEKELNRQRTQIELIASENIVSKAVLEAQGSVLTNKYAEGYPGNRYYGGCEFVDDAETLAIERAKKLFDCGFANVQSHSGAQANFSAFFALLKPEDAILGMSLPSGGHLTHGASVTVSGQWFRSFAYDVNPDTYWIDEDKVEEIALKEKPKLIIAGGSAYPRIINFKRFREIADKIGAYLMVDMAHFAGLVAGGHFPNPLPHAHVVTTTTHKTLRGPRGGMILTNDATIAKKIDSAVFPGTQGGPLMHIISAKGVAFGEALQQAYKDYTKQVIINAQMLSKTLASRGYPILTGGTDCHLLLVNVASKGLTGKEATYYLETLGITCNKNAIPFDTLSPKVTSGIRLGTPAITTRGFKEADCRQVGELIADSLDLLQTGTKDEEKEKFIRQEVLALCQNYPIYTD